MLSAKVQVDSADPKNARDHLEWIIKNAGDKALRDLARLRLAAVLMDDGQLDEALAALAHEPQIELKPRFLEMTGDIQASRGNGQDSKLAYEQAIALITKSEASADAETKRRAASYRDVILAKIDSLGVSPATTAGAVKK